MQEKRQHRSEVEMFAQVSAWDQSGQTQKSYCAAQDIPLCVFTYWVKRYRDSNKGSETKGIGFSEVELPVAGGVGEVFARIRFSSGVEIEFSHRVESSYLRSLLL